MGKEMTVPVIEKTYHPPPGAPDKYWCYLLVEDESGKRVKISLHQKVHDTIAVGDKIHFEKPLRPNKRVRKVERVL